MRGAVARWRSCDLLRAAKVRPAAALVRSTSQSVQLHTPPDRQLNDSCLYVLDLLPLIYRYLPREGSKAPPAPPQSQDKPGEGPAELFISSLLSLVRKHRPPTHMAVAVDVPGATFRNRLYPQYKAQRGQHPPALTEAVGKVLALVDALCIPVLAVPGVEADDVVGTLATKAEQGGFGSVVIVSSDKDYYQLLSPCVSVLHGGLYDDPYTLEDFKAQEELADPKLWRDVKALMGDAADNIPGLKGVGAKTARQLVQAFGPVEQVCQQLAAMPEDKQKQVVKLNKPQRAVLLSEEGRLAATFMKELVTINTHLKAPPCQQPWSVYELKVPADGGKRAHDRAEKMQMYTLRYRINKYLEELADSV